MKEGQGGGNDEAGRIELRNLLFWIKTSQRACPPVRDQDLTACLAPCEPRSKRKK